MQKFTVRAFLRKQIVNSESTYPIYIRVRVHGKRHKVSTGLKAKLSEWDVKGGCYKGSKTSLNNCSLTNELSKINNYLNEQRAIGTILDIELVKSFYTVKDKGDFYEYFDSYCKKKFQTESTADGTQKHYDLTRRRLKEFKRQIRFKDITLSFIEKFDKFVRVNLDSGTHGTFSRHKNLKTVLIAACKEGLISYNPYSDFKVKRGKPKYGSLTEEEIDAIEAIDFTEIENGDSLEISRDMFLFACYTGLRSSDVIKLSNKHIFKKHIKIKMEKNKEFVEVPITSKARKILEKYSGDRNRIFPGRTNQCLNRHLKTIADLCKIEQTITFHLGRHSCATIMANEGINLFIIMKILGHKDIKTTQIYVNPTLNTLVQKMGSVKFFN
jgi:integrase/recombinase XerD